MTCKQQHKRAGPCEPPETKCTECACHAKLETAADAQQVRSLLIDRFEQSNALDVDEEETLLEHSHFWDQAMPPIRDAEGDDLPSRTKAISNRTLRVKNCCQG